MEGFLKPFRLISWVEKETFSLYLVPWDDCALTSKINKQKETSNKRIFIRIVIYLVERTVVYN
jgi:hypothetical protein